jgi:hypothetical protein
VSKEHCRHDYMHLNDELPEREPRGGYTDQQKKDARARIHGKKDCLWNLSTFR